MKKRIILSAIACSLFFAQGVAAAITYDLTPSRESWWREAKNSPCPGEGYYSEWYSSYTCLSNVTLNDGDSIITGPYTSQLYLDKYSTFKGNNTIGSAGRNLSLNLGGQSFSANGLYVYGHVDNGSYIELNESTILGSLRSPTNGIKLTSANIGQNVLAKAQISGSASNISGYVASDNGGVTFSAVDVGSYVEAKNQITVTDGSVGGHILSSNGGVEITTSGATKLIDGYISAKDAVKVTNYKVNQSISAGGYIELNNSNVTGSLTSQSNGSSAIAVSNNSSISGDILTKGYVSISDSNVEGNIDNTQGSNQSMSIVSSQVGGNIVAKGDVDVQSSQVSGTVFSVNEGGKVNDSKIKGNVEVKKYLHVIENSYVCGLTSSSNDGANISNSYVGDDVSTKKYLQVTNSSVFGTASVKNEEMALSSAKIFADAKAIGFPSQKYISISNNSTLCGTANSSYSYDGRVVAYCGLNDPSCSAQQSKGKCPVDLVSSSEYRDFYDYCGITPPEPLPEPQVCINEDFTGENPLQNWTVMGRTDSTTAPQVVGNRFQVSTNQNDQSTASAYKETIPSKDNIVQIEFDHYARNSTTNPGGDGIAIVLSDSNIPPSPGATGGALGYGVKPDMEGFAGGWIAFGIDEYGNFSYQGSFEDSQYRPGRKKHSITIRGAGSRKSFNGSSDKAWFGGYKFIANNTNVGSLDEEGGYDSYGNYLAGRNSSDVHRYRMMVDSREDIPGRASGVWVSIERNINDSKWESIIEPFDVMENFGQPEPPENFMVSITAGTGANTNIHEVANMTLCADRFNLEPKIDHFRFEYDGSGDVCDAQRVTLSACMDSECTETYPPSYLTNPEELEVTLKDLSNAEWQFSNGQSIANNTLTFEHLVNLQIRSQGADSAKLGLEGMSIETPNIEPIKCKLNGQTDYNSACTIVFDSSITVDVPDKVASLPFFAKDGSQQYSSTPFVSLCKSISSMPETDIVKNIEMRFAYEQPKFGETVTVRFKGSNGEFGEPVQLNTTGWTPINNVYFTSSGKASFDLRYPEVGKVSVKARIKDDSESENLSSFVSFPAKLGVTVTSTTAQDGTCNNSDDGCSVGFVAAGEEFDMIITAYQDDGSVAKNYQEETIAISNKVKYPSTGASAKLLNEKLPESSQWSGGRVTFDQSVSDVGAFEFKAQAPIATATDENGDELDKSLYLGSRAFKIQDGNLTVGRFYPGQFSVYENIDADMSTRWAYPNEQSFTYMGQPFGLKQFYIEALSTGGGALRNYAYFDDYFAKFNLYESDYKYIGRFIAPSTYSGEWLNSSNKPYVSGQSVGKFSAGDLVWNKVVSKPDGPLNYLEKSSDTSISIAQSSSSVDKTGVTIGTKELNVQPDIRFGRVDLDDVGGRQGETLHIPLRVEYWNGSRFVVNSNDSQTDVNGIKWDQKHIWPTGEGAAPKDVNLGEGGEVSSGSSRSVTATQAESYRQQSRLWLQLKGGSNNLPWLKYDWDNDGSEENPSSVVTFGIHRGNDRVIYRGEPGLTAQ